MEPIEYARTVAARLHEQPNGNEHYSHVRTIGQLTRAWAVTQGTHVGTRGRLPKGLHERWVRETLPSGVGLVFKSLPVRGEDFRQIAVLCGNCGWVHYHAAPLGVRGEICDRAGHCINVNPEHAGYVVIDETPVNEWEVAR